MSQLSIAFFLVEGHLSYQIFPSNIFALPFRSPRSLLYSQRINPIVRNSASCVLWPVALLLVGRTDLLLECEYEYQSTYVYKCAGRSNTLYNLLRTRTYNETVVI
jgi:hypothetical protein